MILMKMEFQSEKVPSSSTMSNTSISDLARIWFVKNPRIDATNSVDAKKPLFALPKKDPTIGLDLVKKKIPEKPATTEVFKVPMLPQKMNLEKINEYYANEDRKLIEKRQAQIKLKTRQSSYVGIRKSKVVLKQQQQRQTLFPKLEQSDKGCRKALFKASRESIRKSVLLRPSRNAITNKKLEAIGDSLLDSSVVEKKIFKPKSQRLVFKMTSPCVVKKTFSKSPKNFPKKNSPKVSTPKRAVEIQNTVTDSVKKFEKLESDCCNTLDDFCGEIKRLLAKDEKEFNEYKKAREQRFQKIDELLLKIKDVTGVKKAGNSVKRKCDNLRVATLKKSIKFNEGEVDEKAQNAVNLYNSMRKYCGALDTPKININKDGAENNLALDDTLKVLSNKLQQQCILLQGTPARK